MEGLFVLIGTIVAIGVVIQVIKALARGNKSAVDKDPLRPGAGRNAANKRQEALFVSTFPELQPNFHPQKVLDFIAAWRSRTPKPDAIVWNNPPGFGPSRVRLIPKSAKGQPAELLDAADAVVASFILQDHPEGGVIRMGSGKFTASVRDAAVRYWHPQREFKWSKAKGWRMINSLADRPIDSNDHGTSFASDSSSSSSSSFSPGTRAAAAVAGAGGTFDGGGSSASWDEGASRGDGSSSESRTSY